MYRNILVPLDTSDLAECAVPHAVEVARNSGAHIILLSVIDPVIFAPRMGVMPPGNMLVSQGLSPVEFPIDTSDEIRKIEGYLDSVREKLVSLGIPTVTEVREGDPASEICDYAKENSIDLIVMSTHGLSGIRRWVYGSVANRVLQASHTAVLLVRACVTD